MENGLNMLLKHNLAVVNEAMIDFEGQDLAKSTLENYRCNLNRFASILSDQKLKFEELDRHNLLPVLNVAKYSTESIDPTTTNDGRNCVRLSEGRVRNLFSSLSSLIEFLVYADRMAGNPVPAFRKRYLKSYKRSVASTVARFKPSTSQIRAIILESYTIKNKTIHMLFAKTGIRKDTLRTMDIDGLNLTEKWIRVKPRRKRSTIKLPIDDECAEMLHRWLHERRGYKGASSTKALFLNERGGGRIGRNPLGSLVKKAGIKAGLHDESAGRSDIDRKYTCHVYRVWMTTTLRDNGCPDRVIRYIRGDADHSIIDHYDRLEWDTIAKEYQAAMVSILAHADEE